MRTLMAILALLLAPAIARADTVFDGQRFGIGLAVAPVGLPIAHLGIPTGSEQADPHMPAAFVFQWRANGFFALDASLGVPAAMGFVATLEGEFYKSLFADAGRIVSVEVYESPGILFGFAGPDWYARNENAYVGYNYVVQGYLTFALQFPAGVRLRWLRIPLDTYVEAQPTLAVTPSVEQFFELAVGFRVRF